MYQLKHVTSSPHFCLSNRLTEKHNQTAKILIKKALQDGKDPYLSLLEYWSTLILDALGSLAQTLMGQTTKLTVPVTEELLKSREIYLKIMQLDIRNTQ